jgi:flavin-dependent dehydrogenase
VKQGNDFEVAVLGGGIAGLTAALQIKQERPSTSIAVVEKHAHPAPDSAFKVGESVAEVAAIYLKDFMGLGDYLKEHQLRKMGLRWFVTDGENTDITRRVEFGLRQYSPLFNFHLDRGKLENHLVELCDERGIAVIDGTPVAGVDFGPDRHTVTIGRAPRTRELTARWVLDATGRQALLRNKLGLGVDLPIDAAASWFRLPYRIMIDEWSDEPQWRDRVPTGTRWKSTCSLVGEGYWIWIINLGSGASSVGVVADPRFVPFERIRRYDVLLEWIREVEPQLAEHLPEDESGVLDFLKRKNFSATSTRAFSRERWAITGEAAAFLDPLYSTGLDFTAIANTLAADLIPRALDGEPEPELKARIRSHNRAFLGVAALGLPMFRGQLLIYRDAQATGGKFLWDNATYFSILLNMFKSGFIKDPAFIRQMQPNLRLTMTMLEFMEKQFNRWSRDDYDASSAGIPIGGDDLWNNLFYTAAGANLERQELIDHVDISLRRLHTLSRAMCERMSDAAGEPVPEPPYEPLPEVDEKLVVWAEHDPALGGPLLEEGETSWHAHAPLGSPAAA